MIPILSVTEVQALRDRDKLKSIPLNSQEGRKTVTFCSLLNFGQSRIRFCNLGETWMDLSASFKNRRAHMYGLAWCGNTLRNLREDRDAQETLLCCPLISRRKTPADCLSSYLIGHVGLSQVSPFKKKLNLVLSSLLLSFCWQERPLWYNFVKYRFFVPPLDSWEREPHATQSGKKMHGLFF